MGDLNERWAEILKETAGGGSLEQYIEDELTEGIDSSRSASRNQMARAGTGGDPLTSRGAGAYDDIDDDEKTLGEGDPIDEAIAELIAVRDGTHRLDEDDDDSRKRRMSAINTIRGQLEHVWQMLGKAETKLGTARFKADEVDFAAIEETIDLLIQNVKEVMTRIEHTREKVSL